MECERKSAYGQDHGVRGSICVRLISSYGIRSSYVGLESENGEVITKLVR